METPTTAPRAIVEAFIDAIEAREFERARAYLSDDFRYRGPLQTFEDADEFMRDTMRIDGILKRIDRLRIFADGSEVCAILNVASTLPELAETRLVQWARVEQGRIIAMEVFFDARAHMQLFES